MRPRLRNLRMLLACPRLIPHVLLFSYGTCRSIVVADLERWSEILSLGTPEGTTARLVTFVHLMTFLPEFRTLFYMRVGRSKHAISWMCPGLKGLDIVADTIGAGLFIQHGECTFVSAHSIGTNCWIGRQVVVGYSNETDKPTIGNNVRIFAGAKIIGDITIGDNVTVGLNSVVTQNVAPGLSVLGVPAKVIWRSGEPEALRRAG